MDWLTNIFSHLCGQGRCFVSDGASLPLCQRCLGLYLGAGITAVWLATSGLWRRGLPNRGVSVVQVTLILAAMLGGVGLIDPGPTWRAACGLWTGHVAMVWLVGGARHLRRVRRGRSQLPWRAADRVGGLALPAALTALAAGLEWLAQARGSVWAAAGGLGVIALAAALALAAWGLGVYLSAWSRQVRTGIWARRST